MNSGDFTLTKGVQGFSMGVVMCGSTKLKRLRNPARRYGLVSSGM
jgi:hypothetical protein